MRFGALRLYGEELGKALRVQNNQMLLLQPGASAIIAVTRLTSEGGSMHPSESVLPERGFTIPIHLRKPDASGWGTWTAGRFTSTSEWEEGGIGIYDLESDPRVIRNSAFDVIHFNVPRATLNAFTDDAELPSIGTLRATEGRRDVVLHHLAQLLLPSMSQGNVLPDLFLDHFVQMFCSRIVSSYASVSLVPKIHRGGLAPWQKRRTTELLEQHLSGDLRLARLAAECGLSASYFCRCFRLTFGTSVHRFVIERRIAKAKELLLESKANLAQISMETGFSDQAAFSRTFGGVVGLPPAKWRNENLLKSRRSSATRLSTRTQRVQLARSIATPKTFDVGKPVLCAPAPTMLTVKPFEVKHSENLNNAIS